MNRSERLLDLLQILHRYRRPISGAQLAEELGISIRTLYRDIATLQGQGADITGEPGVGYVMKPGFLLPPLMFSQSELEALVLGFRWVEKFGDEIITHAAIDAFAKIAAVLPHNLRREIEYNTLLVGPKAFLNTEIIDLNQVHTAIRGQYKVSIDYTDSEGKHTHRTIWPFALGYFDNARIIAAWCELRQGFRHFQTDRLKSFQITPDRYPTNKQRLLAQWRAEQNHPAEASP